YVFFLQAEDGIRAFHVTGVQTCALPISRGPDWVDRVRLARRSRCSMLYAIGDIQGCAAEFEQLLERIRFDPARDRLWLVGDLVKIGRASCRGRGEIRVIAVRFHRQRTRG